MLVGIRNAGWLASSGATVTAIFFLLSCSCFISNSLFMSILYTHYFGRLRQLRSSNVKENPGLRASRRSCCVVYANIRRLQKNLSDFSFAVRGEDVFFPVSCLYQELHF